MCQDCEHIFCLIILLYRFYRCCITIWIYFFILVWYLFVKDQCFIVSETMTINIYSILFYSILFYSNIWTEPHAVPKYVLTEMLA